MQERSVENRLEWEICENYDGTFPRHVTGYCNILWQALLAVLAVNPILGAISEIIYFYSIPVSLMLSPPCIILRWFTSLVVRSILVLGWLGPKDYVAASIYASDPLIYLTSLCTEVKRPINQPQQVTQPPANAPVFTQTTTNYDSTTKDKGRFLLY